MTPKKQKVAQRQEDRSDLILEKLSEHDKQFKEVFLRLDNQSGVLAQHTSDLKEHAGILTSNRLMLREYSYDFKQLKGMMMQMSQDFSRFKEDISRKIDSFAHLFQNLKDESEITGHTLDRHETMLKAVNKKVGLAHVN